MNRLPNEISDRRDIAAAVTIAAVVSIAIATMLTVGGVHALVMLVSAATSFKSSMIATVLGLGLVLLGPALLFGMAQLLPQWWYRDVKKRFGVFFHT